MIQHEVDRAVRQMRHAADKRMRRRTFAGRATILMLVAACVGLSVLAAPAVSSSRPWNLLRTWQHNTGLEDANRNPHTGNVAGDTQRAEGSSFVVTAWGVVKESRTSYLVVRFEQSIGVHPGKRLQYIGRWTAAGAVTDARTTTWTDGRFVWTRGKSLALKTSDDKLAISGTSCTTTEIASNRSIRTCTGSVAFALAGSPTDAQLVPHDVISVERDKRGHLAGQGSAVLVDQRRVWKLCDLLTCTRLASSTLDD